MAALPGGHGWLVVEFGADSTEAAAEPAEKLAQAYPAKGHDGRVMRAGAQQAKIWDVREAALAITAHRPDTDVSIAAAERVLSPTSRKAAPETIILANGFSCREQIEQCASRPTLHVAELIAGAIGAR